MPNEINTESNLQQADCPPSAFPSSTIRAKRMPVVCRRVDVAAIETRRLERGISRLRLCIEARIDPAAYTNLLRFEGQRSRDAVIIGVLRTLGLAIKDVVTITPGA